MARINAERHASQLAAAPVGGAGVPAWCNENDRDQEHEGNGSITGSDNGSNNGTNKESNSSPSRSQKGQDYSTDDY